MDQNCSKQSPFANDTFGNVSPVLEKHETALLLLLGFGGASICLAVIHKCIRRHVFHDADNVDTAFDAGGQVSTSLTAVTVASQLLWPADLLQGATVTVKSGVSGPFWYTVGAALNIALFPILSVHLKTRAPGAKTFLQIMYARFGRAAHLVFCFMALLVNLLAIATLLVAGVAIIQSLTTEASDEFCVLIIATLFGCYSFVGGLGTTFYVSYFNAVLIFSTLIVLLVKILYSPSTSGETLGSLENIYNKLLCLQGPEGNAERSYLTFKSENGWVFAVMGICLTSSLTYCDQASWQSRIAAKPLQGVLGFLFATYMWFAIPSSISATTGLAYLALSAENATAVLSLEQINGGLVTPFIAEHILGATGGILVLTMVAMALMSTGSGEVMAVSSIIVYDIYQIYIKPFRSATYKQMSLTHRENHTTTTCILCGRNRKPNFKGRESNVLESLKFCECPQPDECKACQEEDDTDVEYIKQHNPFRHSKYRCPYHGDFRVYQDTLLRYKSWCILWVTIFLIPFGLVVKASGVDLNWVMLFGFVITIPCFPAVALSIFFSKTTGPGVISGAIFGMIGGVGAALGVASTYDGGLGDFLKNTVQNGSVLAGSGTSIGISFFVTLIVSLITTKIKHPIDVEREWKKLKDIDNPLHPWCNLYKDDFPDLKPGERPQTEDLDEMFKTAKLAAYIGGVGTLCLLVGVIPGAMISLHVLSLSQFKIWITILQVLCFSMAAIVIVVAPVEEIIQIYRQQRKNKTLKQVTFKEDESMETSIK